MNPPNIEEQLLFIENNKKTEIPEVDYFEKVILYQTKAEVTSTYKSNDILLLPEYKSSFDLTKFNLLKWVLIKDKIYAYKLKEGGCFVFSILKENEKDFNIEIVKEKINYNYNYREYKKDKNKDSDFSNYFKNIIYVNNEVLDKNNLNENWKKKIINNIENFEKKMFLSSNNNMENLDYYSNNQEDIFNNFFNPFGYSRLNANENPNIYNISNN